MTADIPAALEELRHILTGAVAAGASDVHLKGDGPVVFRVNGALVEVDCAQPDEDWMSAIAAAITTPMVRKRLEENCEADFSYECEGIGRFRVNLFKQRARLVCAMRLVKSSIRSIAELHLPDIVKELAGKPNGLILVAGSTGCGKSTTLAAIIEQINSQFKKHIITLEDPIEYVFADKCSRIEQREIGIDTFSFAAGLKNVLRQDPDVVMIGEMRDAESFTAAMRAVNTGHLVISTLHTNGAAQSIIRVLEFFRPEEHEQLRRQLAEGLLAVVCQKLVRGANDQLLPAVEILINTPSVRELLASGQLDTLPAAIESGGEMGMQSFNQALYKMVQENKISREEAIAQAPNPEALKMNFKGIFLDGASKRILGGGLR